MAQDDAEHVRAAAVTIQEDRGAGAEVDLGFLAGTTLQASEGQRGLVFETTDKAADAVVAACIAVLVVEVLENALGRQATVELGADHVAPGFAVAGATGRRQRLLGGARRLSCRRRRADGRIGWFCFRRQRERADGRIGWF